MKEIRLETKAKNNRLFRLIKENYGTIRNFSRISGLAENVVGGFVCFRYCPYYTRGKRRGAPTLTANKIAAIFEKPHDWLFPIELYKRTLGGGFVPSVVNSMEINIQQLKLWGQSSLAANIEEISMDEFMNKEIEKEQISKALQTLPERTQKIIKYRFGMDGEGSKTLEEVSKLIGITRERVRQREGKGIRVMRSILLK